MNGSRKRLLYDLPLIPVPQRSELSAARSYPEIRVIWNGTLMEVIAVRGAVSVGHGDDADIVVDDSVFGEPLHQLITVRDGTATLRLHPTMKGRLYTPEGPVETANYRVSRGDEMALDAGCGAVLFFGPITLAVRMTGRERVRPAPLLERLDHAFVAILLLVFSVGMLLVNAIVETPPIEADILILERGGIFVTVPADELVIEKITPEKRVIIEKKNDGIPDAAQARKATGEEGRVGKKESRVMNTQGSPRKAIDDKVALNTGIMGALTSGAHSLERVFGGGGLGAGLEKTLGMVGGLTGVDQFGAGGLGVRGFATGGGGNALGIGGMATRGKGGTGARMGYGMNKGRIDEKGLSRIDAGGSGAVMLGALDRAVIDAYIKRNIAKIRWCYEKELARIPTLFGKVTVNFTISKTGQVSLSKIDRSTMASEPVESCVASAIRKIRFPAPKGGGIVVVTYPFVFKHAVN